MKKIVLLVALLLASCATTTRRVETWRVIDYAGRERIMECTFGYTNRAGFLSDGPLEFSCYGPTDTTFEIVEAERLSVEFLP